MSRWLWLLALAATFAAGWAGATLTASGPTAVREARDHEAMMRLQREVDTLRARLGAHEELTGGRPTAMTRPRSDAGRAAGREASFGVVRGERSDSVAPAVPAAPSASTVRVPGGASTTGVQAALDRFYRYRELTSDTTAGRERWQKARELLDELRAMGPAAGQALMHVLAAGTDSDERRTAARLLGQLQVAAALPLLKDIIERENDVLLRRAAAVGLRQLQTPESLPVMERMVSNPTEDRFVRLSASVGLAESGRPLGVTALAHIFEESSSDGRGREVAFRALANLKDERPLAFMRQVAASPVEPNYRLQAIRYLSTQRDEQALATLGVLMNAPNEQPSIRDAAAQAYAAINTRR